MKGNLVYNILLTCQCLVIWFVFRRVPKIVKIGYQPLHAYLSVRMQQPDSYWTEFH
jgi:hypothetical protein